MKKYIKKYICGVFISWFGIFVFPSSFAFAQTPSCDNFNAATYTIANNDGSSKFFINTPIETSLSLKVKEAIARGENVDIILVMDRSGSMNSKETPSGQTKIQAAKSALNSVADLVAQAGNLNNRVALVTFSSDTTLDQPLTNDYNRLKVAINSIGTGGYTSIGGGLLGAASQLKTNSTNLATRKFIILASDGLQNTAPSISTAIAAVPRDTTVYTVGIGADADSRALGKIAGTAGARNGAYFSSNATNLVDIFQNITKRILGAFTLNDIKLSLTRDDISSTNLAETLPVNNSYDPVNGIIRWDNLGSMVNGQQKNIAIYYKGVKVERNIPLNTFSLLLNYRVFGATCSENVPVNVLFVNIAQVAPSSSCADTAWIPDFSTICSTQTFIQTSNCGIVHSSRGTKLCTQCSDGLDNDTDGFIDYPSDRGCTSLFDDNEGEDNPHFFEL